MHPSLSWNSLRAFTGRESPRSTKQHPASCRALRSSRTTSLRRSSFRESPDDSSSGRTLPGRASRRRARSRYSTRTWIIRLQNGWRKPYPSLGADHGPRCRPRFVPIANALTAAREFLLTLPLHSTAFHDPLRTCPSQGGNSSFKTGFRDRSRESPSPSSASVAQLAEL